MPLSDKKTSLPLSFPLRERRLDDVESLRANSLLFVKKINPQRMLPISIAACEHGNHKTYPTSLGVSNKRLSIRRLVSLRSSMISGAAQYVTDISQNIYGCI